MELDSLLGLRQDGMDPRALAWELLLDTLVVLLVATFLPLVIITVDEASSRFP